MNSEAKDFLVRCLNGAANLYGVLTLDEFLTLYNGYIRERNDDGATPLAPDELAALIDRLIVEHEEEERSGIADDIWFDRWTDPETNVGYLVYDNLLIDEDADCDEIDERIREQRDRWVVKALRWVTEKQLLAYEDPMFGEESKELEALARIIRTPSAMDDMAEMDASGAQASMRNSDTPITRALGYLYEFTDYTPEDKREYEELISILTRLERVTREWRYRGHTQQELVETKLLTAVPTEEIPSFEDAFDGCEDDEYGEDEYGEDDGYGEDDEAVEIDSGDPDISIRRMPKSMGDAFTASVEGLPPAAFTGPVDFAFVKDASRRDKILADYLRVRDLTKMFVTSFVMAEMTAAERRAAFKRLGFEDAKDDPRFPLLARNRDIVAGDFGSMMDDQNGLPAIRRLLTQGVMSPRIRRIADYYENYRYTWLHVEAVKAGIGLKCRDLMTGEDLFLMETSVSQSPNVKGMTLCCGIAPMGEVYLSLGVIQPSNFENPETILKIVLTHLKLPTELPIRLTFSQQAAFAAETIRRLDANGRFATVGY